MKYIHALIIYCNRQLLQYTDLKYTIFIMLFNEYLFLGRIIFMQVQQVYIDFIIFPCELEYIAITCLLLDIERQGCIYI